MLQANNAPDNLSLATPTPLEDAINRFEDAWQQGGRPAIDDHLGGDEGRGALLVELVHVDLEYRLKAGEPARVEDYLGRHPDLGRDRQAFLDLLAAEWRLRLRRDPSVNVEEYEERFPGCRTELMGTATFPLSGEQQLADGTVNEALVGDAVTQSRYRVLRTYARGGLGEILAACDEDLHREVALKRLQPRRAHDADSRSRFLREAEITGRLEHPGVVPVYGLGQAADGSPVYAMRLIRGETLQEAADRFHRADGPGDRSREFRQLLSRFLSVCNTAAYGHSRGVVHRDLKPGNILLGSYGETVVVDWGLARTAASEADGTPPLDPVIASLDAELTQAGDVIGTPAYMSPEQADGRRDRIGPASDIYSLGATLYVLLTGRPPFGPGQVSDILEKVRRSDFPRPRQVKKDIAPALEAICLKAMAQRSEQRYGTALALAADLEQWLAGEPVGAWREPSGVRVRRWVARHGTLVTAAAVALAAGAVLAVVTAFWFAAADRAQASDDREAAAHELAEVRRGELERADRERYFFQVAGADQEWWADRFAPAALLLSECPLRLRGWEWNYLTRRGRDIDDAVTLGNHGKEAWNVAFSPDGGRVASVGLDGTARVWDVASRKLLFELETMSKPESEPPAPIWGVAYSSDGALLATGGGDQAVHLWDAATGRGVRSFAGLAGEVHSVAFSPDGKTLAAAVVPTRNLPGIPNRAGGEIRLWDVASEAARDPFPVVSGSPTCVAFSPDGKTVVAGTMDWKVRRWNVLSGDEQESLVGHGSSVRAVAFSADGRFIASASSDWSVGVWDAATGKAKHILRGHTMPAWGVAFSPDSRLVASSADDSTIKVWDASLGRLVQTLHGHTAGIANVAFSPDGLQLASASDDQTVKLWKVGASRTAPRLIGHKHSVWGVAFSPDGRRVASAGGAASPDGRHDDDDAVRVWDAGGRQQAALHVPGGSRAAVFSPDNKRLAAAGEDGAVHVWEVDAGWREHVLHGHSGKALSVAFSPDGRLLASASADHTVKIWDVATEKELLTLRAHEGAVRSVAFSADGRRLASGGDDRVVKIWDAATGREERSLTGQPGAVHAVAFSPDGKRLAAATAALKRVLTEDSGATVVWNLETGQTAFTLRGGRGDVRAVAYSPDGKRLVSAGSDGWLKLWEPTTGREILTLYDAHLDCVNAVAFSTDGTHMASASCDGTVILWNGSPPDDGPD